MKYEKVLSILLCIVTFLQFIVPATATATDVQSYYEKPVCTATLDDNFIEDEIIVVIDSSWNNAEYSIVSFEDIECTSVLELANFHNDRESRILCLTIANGTKQKVLDAIAALERRNDIYSAEPNYVATVTVTPNDTEYVEGDMSATDRIDLPAAWDINTGSSNVQVGVIDSGVNALHPDLINRVNAELSRSFSADYDNPLEDDLDHGTHVAGIIGAEGNNAAGVVGVCWNVELISLRVDVVGGTFPLSNVIQAIEYATELAIPILNYSAGGPGSTALETAISNYPGLFVCSAGNEGEDNDQVAHFPANYELDNIISVGASNSYDRKRSTSNYGKTSVDIFAPGVKIMSTLSDGGYGIKSGTSMAAPFVSGVAALLLSEYPSMTTEQLKGAIMNHAEIVYDEDNNNVFGELCVSGGRLNAYNVFNHDYSISSSTSIYTHSSTCLTCGYTVYEAHVWVDKSDYYRCLTCGMESLVVPGQELNSMLQEVSIWTISNNNFLFVDDNTLLCYFDNKYYYVKAKNKTEAQEVLFNANI